MANIFRVYRFFDWPLFVAVVLLIFFGITAQISMALGGVVAWLDVLKHVVFALTGLAWVFVLSRFDYRAWRGSSVVLYLALISLLVLVLIWGATIRGTTGWFVFGPIHFQPVEFFKLGLVLVLATLLSGWSSTINRVSHLGIILAVILVPVSLVLVQPDFGSALVLLSIGVGMLFVSTIRPRVIFVLFAILAVFGVVLWFFVLSDWQHDRVLSFVQPSRDPLGRGYNMRQSLIAVGSGGFMGKGLGAGSQGQLRFLPEASTDFVFALLSEEMGFLGSTVILALLAFFFYRIWRITQGLQNSFYVLLVWGISVMLIVPTVINIGMNIGVLPVTGLPLLFVSRGGSALWSTLMAVGILQSVVIRERMGQKLSM